ncbi:MAG: uroporphyrinogen decarboxylase family protein, partial [Anaerolineales bacterium]|nr:uroporphyrinogen decarboxylase family protein [Anaerolineales bacterium]
MTDLSNIADVKIPDPHKDGLFPKAIEHYSYMIPRVDPALIEAYPFIVRGVMIMGPLEVVSAMTGATTFFESLYTKPEIIHELLERVTQGLIRYLSALEKINGGHKFIMLGEHTPGQISPKHSEEFFVPYERKISD